MRKTHAETGCGNLALVITLANLAPVNRFTLLLTIFLDNFWRFVAFESRHIATFRFDDSSTSFSRFLATLRSVDDSNHLLWRQLHKTRPFLQIRKRFFSSKTVQLLGIVATKRVLCDVETSSSSDISQTFWRDQTTNIVHEESKSNDVTCILSFFRILLSSQF